jgi:Holliday junction DNA helicase RuvA
MIGKLTGRFGGEGADGSVIIDVRGVGYQLRVPAGSVQELRLGSGDVSLFVHTAVRDDAIDLYGFMTEEELLFFKQLMSVSGIGPKSALAILNVSDVGTLKRGIARGDAASLTKVFGIGKKSAERIVVELREKVSLTISRSDAPAEATSDAEVIEALMALGYSAHESREALRHAGDEGSAREKVAAALRHLGSPKTAA